ncbi:Flavone 3'-O-methyltransferase 1 [Abeliophyllum distichum]|uniref:Flavone 3'-O-methyltransferase 1 n=1 Tax=Abeliophyllum distichum TaxID=126358 RepID=A0ABD1URE2_9LAMI
MSFEWVANIAADNSGTLFVIVVSLECGGAMECYGSVVEETGCGFCKCPGAFVSALELDKQLPTKNPDAASMVDRILRLLACYSVVNCSLKNQPDGGGAAVERVYSLAPVCKFLTKNLDGVSIAPVSLMNQEKLFIEAW